MPPNNTLVQNFDIQQLKPFPRKISNWNCLLKLQNYTFHLDMSPNVIASFTWNPYNLHNLKLWIVSWVCFQDICNLLLFDTWCFCSTYFDILMICGVSWCCCLDWNCDYSNMKSLPCLQFAKQNLFSKRK